MFKQTASHIPISEYTFRVKYVYLLYTLVNLRKLYMLHVCCQGSSQPSSCGGAELHFLPYQLIRMMIKNITKTITHSVNVLV